jgi:arginine deiminase
MVFSGIPEKYSGTQRWISSFLLPKESDDRKITLEGGDVMVVTQDHLLIGVSERTTMEAAHQAIHLLFEKGL